MDGFFDDERIRRLGITILNQLDPWAYVENRRSLLRRKVNEAPGVYEIVLDDPDLAGAVKITVERIVSAGPR